MVNVKPTVYCSIILVLGLFLIHAYLFQNVMLHLSSYASVLTHRLFLVCFIIPGSLAWRLKKREYLLSVSDYLEVRLSLLLRTMLMHCSAQNNTHCQVTHEKASEMSAWEGHFSLKSPPPEVTAHCVVSSMVLLKSHSDPQLRMTRVHDCPCHTIIRPRDCQKLHPYSPQHDSLYVSWTGTTIDMPEWTGMAMRPQPHTRATGS